LSDWWSSIFEDHKENLLRALLRPRRLAVAGVLLVLGGGVAAAQAGAFTTSPSPTGTDDVHGLILGSADSAQPQNMEQFLTAVTKDVDAYWTKAFADAGQKEPRVTYQWIPAGQTAAGACGDLGDTAAAYCPGDDTIYISEKFATDIYNGTLDRVLPGSSQGYGRTVGDFAVAYIVAHEYGHQVQAELGLFDRGLPTVNLELQADCYAGTWANSAYKENRLEDGDVQEALDAALAVGDFDADNPGHHGTPEQREQAWNAGFESGDPGTCNTYVQSDGGSAEQAQPQEQAPQYPQEQQSPEYPQADPGYGYPQQDPGYDPYGVVS
jgi:predicted metalloprotease